MPLYVVATPVGNLEDITRRAARVLAEVDVVLAEDTRRTRVLLDALDVTTPTRAYHDHTDAERRAAIVEALACGTAMALVSDAGTPCVSDPGYELIRDALAVGVEVVPIPGASSVLAFLAAAGLPSHRFQFVGFAPRKAAARSAAVGEWLAYGGATVALESPNRVVALLTELAEADPERPVVVGRELTKLHEEFVRGSAATVAADLGGRDRVRGELVVGIAPPDAPSPPTDAEIDAWAEELVAAGLRTKEVARILGRRLGLSGDDAYSRALRARGD